MQSELPTRDSPRGSETPITTFDLQWAGGRSFATRVIPPILTLCLALAPASCRREESGEIPVREASRESMQTAPPGEVVARLRSDQEIGVTIYQPPPDLSRKDIGVVFIPSDVQRQSAAQAQPQAGTTAPPDTLVRPGGRR